MKEVKNFYKNIPFNYFNKIEYNLDSICGRNSIREYKDLHSLLSRFKIRTRINDVIEFGCGTGLLANSISYYYRKNITAIDYTNLAIATAKKTSQALNLDVKYILSDIFNYHEERLYDLVISNGVLHHTYDCKKAFKTISRFIKPGGYIYLGLYHKYGRKPMLQFLQGYNYWHGEQAAYNLFRRMNNHMPDNVHSYSWFRDQVLHPKESQHTLSEIIEWLDDLSLTLCSTSINNYKRLSDTSIPKLLFKEKSLEEYSYKKNVIDLEFFPGFFSICARKAN